MFYVTNVYRGVHMLIIDEKNHSLYIAVKKLGDSSRKGYVILAKSGNDYVITQCNDLYTELTNVTCEELIGQSYRELFVSLQQDAQNLIDIVKKEELVCMEFKYLCKNDTTFYCAIECLPFQNVHNHTEFVLLLFEDITSRKIEQLQRDIEEKIYKSIEFEKTFEEKVKIICNEVDLFSDPFTFTTVLLKREDDTLMTMASDQFVEKIGNTQFKEHLLTPIYNEAIQKTTPTIVENIAVQNGLIEDYKQFALHLNLTRCCHIPILSHKKQGIGLIAIYSERYHFDCSIFIRLFEKISNLISLAYSYSMSQRKIQELAFTDVPTGLANRQSFIEHLEQQVKKGLSGFVKLIQPSEYANIVELYGHKAGDDLLRQIANRIDVDQYFQPYTIARFSTSTLIVSRIVSEHEEINFGECIHELVKTPFLLGDKEIYITLKMGVALFNSNVSAEEVVRHGDIALSYAKRQPGTHLEMFTEERSESLERQMEILNHLTYAVNRQEISVHLQPKVNLLNGQVTSLEALARWVSPSLGFVSPAEFIPVAESAGKIRDIDLQVFELVLQWIQQRQRDGKKLYRVSVNVSPAHFYHPTFVEDMRYLVETYYVDPREIIIEVTESIGLVDLQKAFEIMQQLKLYGFDASVDDFGVGFSSLSYLQKLPFKELKIDRSFINRIEEAGTEAIVRAIIQLAHVLEMDVVAEGLETEEQVQRLMELGCKKGQGYKYYKPIPIEEINEIL